VVVGSGLFLVLVEVWYFILVWVLVYFVAMLFGQLAWSICGFMVVAFGLFINLVDFVVVDFVVFVLLCGIHVMGGVAQGFGEGGVGEWNVVVDLVSFQVVFIVGWVG